MLVYFFQITDLCCLKSETFAGKWMIFHKNFSFHVSDIKAITGLFIANLAVSFDVSEEAGEVSTKEYEEECPSNDTCD